MGGLKFFIKILCLFDITNKIETFTTATNSNDLYFNPKDEVEFVNPYDSETKPIAGAAASASSSTEADDMNTPQQVDNKMPSELVITTLQNMPFSGTTMENGTLVGEGYAFYIFNLLRSRMNFTYRIVLPSQRILGDERTGVIGQLVKKEVDMAVAFLPVTPEIRRSIKYSTALGEVQWTILMKRPGESATGSGLLAPFDTNVWILILISVIAVGPIIYTLIFLRFLLCKNGEPRKYSLATCMWFVYGALLKQGSTLSPVTDSARLLFATWWIFITILTSFYTANLTAFLTLSQFTLPINSADDLANKNQKWMAREGGFIERIVNDLSNEELAVLHRSYQKGNGEFINLPDKDGQEVLGYVKANKMYIRERPLVTELLFHDYMNKTREGVLEVDRCTYVIMPRNILTKDQAFGFQLNSTLDKMFNKKLLDLVETGIIKFKTSEHLPGTEICPLNLGSKERQLRITDLTMTYKGMLIGFAVAVLSFTGEIIYRKIIKGEKVNNEIINDQHNNLPFYKNDAKLNKNGLTTSFQRSPPPLYQNINVQDYSKRQFINGRDYYIVREKDGEKRLVPVRTPSAFLYQYPA